MYGLCNDMKTSCFRYVFAYVSRMFASMYTSGTKAFFVWVLHLDKKNSVVFFRRSLIANFFFLFRSLLTFMLSSACACWMLIIIILNAILEPFILCRHKKMPHRPLNFCTQMRTIIIWQSRARKVLTESAGPQCYYENKQMPIKLDLLCIAKHYIGRRRRRSAPCVSICHQFSWYCLFDFHRSANNFSNGWSFDKQNALSIVLCLFIFDYMTGC